MTEFHVLPFGTCTHRRRRHRTLTSVNYLDIDLGDPSSYVSEGSLMV